MALFAVYARKDVTAVQSVMAEDIIWRISGHHPLAGPKHGIQEVMAFFDQLARADFKAQLYRKHIYPHLVSMLGNPKPIRKVRQRIVPLAHGEVLDIGVGPGVNLVHYDPEK